MSKLEELAREYANNYNVIDIDMRGEIERTNLGWEAKSEDFEQLISEVRELLKSAMIHAYHDAFKKACALILEEAEKKYYLYSKRESKYMKNPEVLIRDDLQQIIKEMTDE